MFIKRFNFPCILHNNKVYVIGGRSYGQDQTAILSDCEYYDLEVKKWFYMPGLKVPRCGHQLLLYEGRLFVIGGLSNTSNSKKFEVFDFIENTWNLLNIKLHMNLYNFEIYPKDVNEFYIIGGCHAYGTSDFIHEINLKNWTVQSVGFLSVKRSHFKLFFEAQKNRLIMLGGVGDDDPLVNTRFVETFDLVTKKSDILNSNFEFRLEDIQKFSFSKFSCKIQSLTNVVLEDSTFKLYQK
jgi:hypothetical protein